MCQPEPALLRRSGYAKASRRRISKRITVLNRFRQAQPDNFKTDKLPNFRPVSLSTHFILNLPKTN
jgi:hypothetical protein